MEKERRTIVELAAKNTIGYSEAENKESFMIGVSVAISILEKLIDKENKDLRESLKYSENAREIYLNDLKNLSSIINRYSE